MLELRIPKGELYDGKNREFFYVEEQVLQLEHSLSSISKWESKWCKPFLTGEAKNIEEVIDYIRCMTLTPDVDPYTYRFITDSMIEKVHGYIEAPMTATWFREDGQRKANRDIITAELIYHRMLSYDIPLECERWHLNRLLTLIRVCEEKNAPKKNMSMREIMNENRAINEARKKQMHSRG